MFEPNGIITLTTDFGVEDAYVAIMKGVIMAIAPAARLIDYTHGVTPGNVIEAAYLLQSGYTYFPRGTTHLVVVDPGVGSDRRALAVQTPEAAFVGPDNGLFTAIVADARTRWADHVQVVELNDPRFWLSSVSATFHGRDIFAPVAARIATGTPLRDMGRPVVDMVQAHMVVPEMQQPGVARGEIIHIDRFGNCITNITYDHLERFGLGDRVVVSIIDQQLPGLTRTYTESPVSTPICLMGSSGHLELAVCNGSAARTLGVDVGDRFMIRRRMERTA